MVFEVGAGCLCAIATAAWAISVRGASFYTFAAAFLLVGACSGIWLLLRGKNDVDWSHAAAMAIVLLSYQSMLLLALRTGIQTMQALVNANMLFIVVIDAITGVTKFNSRTFVVCCAHALLGYFIAIMRTAQPQP